MAFMKSVKKVVTQKKKATKKKIVKKKPTLEEIGLTEEIEAEEALLEEEPEDDSDFEEENDIPTEEVQQRAGTHPKVADLAPKEIVVKKETRMPVVEPAHIKTKKIATTSLTVRPKSDFSACIGGTRYNFKLGTTVEIPVGVAKLLIKAKSVEII